MIDKLIIINQELSIKNYSFHVSKITNKKTLKYSTVSEEIIHQGRAEVGMRLYELRLKKVSIEIRI